MGRKKLEGTWTVLSAEQEGKPVNRFNNENGRSPLRKLGIPPNLIFLALLQSVWVTLGPWRPSNPSFQG